MCSNSLGGGLLCGWLLGMAWCRLSLTPRETLVELSDGSGLETPAPHEVVRKVGGVVAELLDVVAVGLEGVVALTLGRMSVTMLARRAASVSAALDGEKSRGTRHSARGGKVACGMV